VDDVVKSGAISPAIRRALVGSFALLILLTGGAILGMGIRSAYRAVDDLSRELITTRAQQIERRLDGFFGPVHSQLRIAREWGRAGLRPLDDVRGVEFREENPTYDGRGVKVAMIDMNPVPACSRAS